MKEIKAYLRKSRVKAVVARLQEAGAPGITVVEVHPVGYGYEPNYFEPGFEQDVLKRYKYLEIVKIELVCEDNDLQKLAVLIQQECQTGARGDGWIFVSDVVEAIRIRDGRRGSLVGVH
jgi:nitrogen regulatory protein P-II 1